LGRDDDTFDQVFPAPIRLASRRFWTPVAVARRAAELLRGAGAMRVLDVGSGAGKFVLAAATAAPELEFVGIEHRKHLVAVARRVRSRLRIDNASFRTGDAIATSWAPYDAFYFFNPLAENLFAAEDRLDEKVELSDAKFVRDVLGIEAALRAARCGTVVLTYHGPSVRMPGSYGLEHTERAGSDWLRLWVKRKSTDDGAFFFEVGDTVERWPVLEDRATGRAS
jgi:SAM-dependent methyltransferase